MTGPPDLLTDPPPVKSDDPVDEILSGLHLSGGVIIESDFRGDWSIATQFVPEQCAQFFPVTGALIGYHYVREGSLWASVAGSEPLHAPPGSLIVLPRNDPHLLYTAELEPVPAHTLVDDSDPSGLLRIRLGDDGDWSRLYCGILGTAEPDPPILDRLPPLLIIEPESHAHGEWLASSLHLATSAATLPRADASRLVELLVRSTLRDLLHSLAQEHHGWLDGLRDRYVARSLALIHRHFAEPIDMAWLSREVGLSRSALHDRFVGTLGEPPMRYCTRWRLRHAKTLLRETSSNTASVAFAVGYASEAAFNRAFKREFGEPPATWRRHAADCL